jgi:hypothetical protein
MIETGCMHETAQERAKPFMKELTRLVLLPPRVTAVYPIWLDSGRGNANLSSSFMMACTQSHAQAQAQASNRLFSCDGMQPYCIFLVMHLSPASNMLEYSIA